MPPVNTDLLKKRRDELDLSNNQLAELVNVSQDYIRNVICGADDPSSRLIHRFARVLGIPFEEIVTSGDRTPQGDPSEPPAQPGRPPAPPSRQDKEGGKKAPKRAEAVAP